MLKSLTILKGGSGAGKGTRVAQLMEYLRSHSYNSETATYRDEEGKSHAVGKFFPAIGLFIAGKYNISNKSGLTSWNGVDSLHSTFKTAEKTREVIKSMVEILRAEHVILEGEPMFLSDKYRPKFLYEFYAPEVVNIIYYMYNGREQYDERILGRSGKLAGDSGWTRVASYEKEYPVSVEEAKSFNGSMVTFCPVDQRVGEFTRWFLCDNVSKFIGKEIFNFKEVLHWCEANPMLRSVSGEDPLNKNGLW